MADLENRIPGRMILMWVAKPLVTGTGCNNCHAETAFAHWVQLLPPVVPPTTPDVVVADALYELWLGEQQQGIQRLSAFEALGVTCVAQRAAQYMMQPTIARDFQMFFAGNPFPDQLVGAMAVEPGADGKTYPMVLGIPEPRSLADLIAFINASVGTVDVSDDVIPLEP